MIGEDSEKRKRIFCELFSLTKRKEEKAIGRLEKESSPSRKKKGSESDISRGSPYTTLQTKRRKKTLEIATCSRGRERKGRWLHGESSQTILVCKKAADERKGESEKRSL